MNNKDKIEEALKNARLNHIVIYDLKDKSPLFDFVFVATASSMRHLEASKKYIDEIDLAYDHVEGLGSSWILFDFNDFIVHIMTEESRKLFGIDDILMPYKKEEID